MTRRDLKIIVGHSDLGEYLTTGIFFVSGSIASDKFINKPLNWCYFINIVFF